MVQDCHLFFHDGPGGIRNLIGLIRADEQDSVLIPDHDVAGIDDLATHGHGDVDLTRPVFIRPVGARRPGIHWEILHGGKTFSIPDGTVADDAANPPALAVGGHQLAKDGPVCEPAGVNDDHVPPLRQVHGGVEHQVVALGKPNREGGPQHLSSADWLNGCFHCGDPSHTVVNIRHGHPPEPLYRLRGGTDKVPYDLTSNRHAMLLLLHLDHFCCFVCKW